MHTKIKKGINADSLQMITSCNTREHGADRGYTRKVVMISLMKKGYVECRPLIESCKKGIQLSQWSRTERDKTPKMIWL